MPATLRAGQLRSRITLESPARVSDGAGGSTTTWTTYASVWAERLYLSGGEQVEAEQLVMREVPSFSIRRTTAIAVSSDMRVRDGSDLFSIRTIAKDDRDRSRTMLICEELIGE